MAENNTFNFDLDAPATPTLTLDPVEEAAPAWFSDAAALLSWKHGHSAVVKSLLCRLQFAVP